MFARSWLKRSRRLISLTACPPFFTGIVHSSANHERLFSRVRSLYAKTISRNNGSKALRYRKGNVGPVPQSSVASNAPARQHSVLQIFHAGFSAAGKKLGAVVRPGSAAALLVHFAIGCYFFVHYVANVRPTNGPSMLPTFAISGDSALVCWLYARGDGIKAGDIISYQHPVLRGEFVIKRIIGMEGDYVLRDTPGGLDGQFVDIEKLAQEEEEDRTRSGYDQIMVKVPKGHCWVVGDNLGWSRDSRTYGPVPLALVRGKVLAIKKSGWPWQGWHTV